MRGTAAQASPEPFRPRFSPACAGNGLAASSRAPDRAVQPRVCGERVCRGGLRRRRRGSAPRVRGTGCCRGEVEKLKRFSPACAGNGWDHMASTVSAAVQPRVCGERIGARYFHDRIRGSAPRVRGTGPLRRQWINHGRFSPACAGNGARSATGCALRPVQPRVCGERAGDVPTRSSKGGSAPRVRGTGHPPDRWSCAHRFSPACAGNGLLLLSPACSTTVQPRVCGERGWVADLSVCAARFSPACAGNGRHGAVRLRAMSVQPRVCGERRVTCTSPVVKTGSAPRVRGTAHQDRQLLLAWRFSPACAGNGFPCAT